MADGAGGVMDLIHIGGVMLSDPVGQLFIPDRVGLGGKDVMGNYRVSQASEGELSLLPVYSALMRTDGSNC